MICYCQNHIAVLGYVTHSIPIQIFITFNQYGNVKKMLVYMPLFTKFGAYIGTNFHATVPTAEKD